jgi:protein associated with RNAse G/E
MAEYDQKFSSEQEWINKGNSWLTRHPNYCQFFRAFCFDSSGMICKNGGDFAKAIYPVYWIWPDQNLFNMVDSIKRV